MGNRIHLQLLEILDQYIQKRVQKVMSHALIRLMKEIHDSKDLISNMLITEVTVKSCLKNQ